MKKLLPLLLLLVTAFQGFSQTAGISYQAVILNPNPQEIPGQNAQNTILANSAVSIQFTIVNASGTEEYQEQHSTRTDRYGMINLLIGTGTPTSSVDFTDIKWLGTTKKLKVGIDFKGGSNFSPLSEQNLSYMPQPPTEEVSLEITNNSAAISTEKARAMQAEQANAGGISALQAEQTIQNAAITLNTAKVGITLAQATTISNTTGINTGDQDISGIEINAAALTAEESARIAGDAENATAISEEQARAKAAEQVNALGISTLEVEQSAQNAAITLNTSKVGITPAQVTTISNTTGINTGDQDISGIAVNATAIATESERATAAEQINALGISTLEVEQATQNAAITLNTAKVGITPSQATTLSNTLGNNTGDQDLSSYATKDMANGAITNLADPTNAQDSATKAYVDLLEAKLETLKSLVYKNIPAVNLLADGVSVSDLLASGVSISDLLAGGASISDLLAEGVSVSDLLAGGASVSDLLAEGVSGSDLVSYLINIEEKTIQEILDLGITPKEIYDNNNADLNKLYGLDYQGGIIFYFDSLNGNGLVFHFGLGTAPWGCNRVDLPDVPNVSSPLAYEEGARIGDGYNNTMAIINNCDEPNIAAKIAKNYNGGGFDDWYLPATKELYELVPYVRDLANNADYFGYFWSSSEMSRSSAQTDYDYYNDASTPTPGASKFNKYYVIAIRAF